MSAGQLVGIIAIFLEAIAYLLVARALVSWFPDLRQYQIVQLLFDITDPIIQPLRRLIPPVGALDLSVMIAVFALFVIAQVLRASV